MMIIIKIRVGFRVECQLQQSGATQAIVNAEWSVSIVHPTLAWTTGSLERAQILMHAIAHGGVRIP